VKKRLKDHQKERTKKLKGNRGSSTVEDSAKTRHFGRGPSPGEDLAARAASANAFQQGKKKELLTSGTEGKKRK